MQYTQINRNAQAIMPKLRFLLWSRCLRGFGLRVRRPYILPTLGLIDSPARFPEYGHHPIFGCIVVAQGCRRISLARPFAALLRKYLLELVYTYQFLETVCLRSCFLLQFCTSLL